MEILTDDFSWLEFTGSIKERSIKRRVKRTQEELWLKLYNRSEDGRQKGDGGLKYRKIIF